MPEIFAVFFLSGIIIGIVYDLLSFLRFVFRGRVLVFILDFLFFVVFSFAFFIPLLAYNNGSVRVMYFTVYSAGFLLYLASVYRLTLGFKRQTADFLRGLFKKALKSFKKVLQFIKRLYYNKFVKHLTFTKKLKAGSKNESASSKNQ